MRKPEAAPSACREAGPRFGHCGAVGAAVWGSDRATPIARRGGQTVGTGMTLRHWRRYRARLVRGCSSGQPPYVFGSDASLVGSVFGVATSNKSRMLPLISG
jgi:hypothetical protein